MAEISHQPISANVRLALYIDFIVEHAAYILWSYLPITNAKTLTEVISHADSVQRQKPAVNFALTCLPFREKMTLSVAEQNNAKRCSSWMQSMYNSEELDDLKTLEILLRQDLSETSNLDMKALIEMYLQNVVKALIWELPI